jgi:hypothetical protein
LRFELRFLKSGSCFSKAPLLGLFMPPIAPAQHAVDLPIYLPQEARLIHDFAAGAAMARTMGPGERSE